MGIQVEQRFIAFYRLIDIQQSNGGGGFGQRRAGAGLVRMLSAILSLDREPVGFSWIKARIWTASLTFVEYFMSMSSLNVNLIITAC